MAKSKRPVGRPPAAEKHTLYVRLDLETWLGLRERALAASAKTGLRVSVSDIARQAIVVGMGAQHG